MITNATVVQKSDKYPKVGIFADIDISYQKVDAQLEIFTGLTSKPAVVKIPVDDFATLVMYKGELSPQALKEIRNSHSALAFMELEFLNELSLLCFNIRTDAKVLFKK